ncbi:MAG: hypothetical protein F6K58_27990 [Symploca sp. SIO2E9]|nr:hypothetical protein [Symploca sp. SIO2E9]
MKLLFDQNLSPRLVWRLSDIYPNSSHVFNCRLDQANDIDIWQYCRDNDYIIVTKDSDFNELVVLLGFPPKVIWVRRGNCTTTEIETILRTNVEYINNFSLDPNLGTLTLWVRCLRGRTVNLYTHARNYNIHSITEEHHKRSNTFEETAYVRSSQEEAAYASR